MSPFLCPECNHESSSYLTLLRHVGQRHLDKLELKGSNKREWMETSKTTSDGRKKRLKSSDQSDALGFQVLQVITLSILNLQQT